MKADSPSGKYKKGQVLFCCRRCSGWAHRKPKPVISIPRRTAWEMLMEEDTG